MIAFIKRHHVMVVSVFLCLFSLYLVSTPKKGTGGEIIVKKALFAASKPIQTAFLKIHSTISGILGEYVLLVGAKEENRVLYERINALTEENIRLGEELILNQRLKELLDFKTIARVKTVAGRVVSLSGFGLAGGWTRVLVLDKGRLNGIEKDMAVINAQGMVGRVVEAGNSTSTVLLVTDPRSNIDVILQRTRVRGIITGNGSGLVLKYLREMDDVRVGDKLITAGISGIFPKGIVVGEVVNVEKGRDNFFKYIEASPAVGFSELEEALIVTGKADSLDAYENAPLEAKDSKAREPR